MDLWGDLFVCIGNVIWLYYGCNTHGDKAVQPYYKCSCSSLEVGGTQQSSFFVSHARMRSVSVWWDWDDHVRMYEGHAGSHIRLFSATPLEQVGLKKGSPCVNMALPQSYCRQVNALETHHLIVFPDLIGPRYMSGLICAWCCVALLVGEWFGRVDGSVASLPAPCFVFVSTYTFLPHLPWLLAVAIQDSGFRSSIVCHSAFN